MNIKNLEENFEAAKRLKVKYVGVLIEMPGFEKPEVIINENKNFDSKLDYYRSAYDEDLNHKHAPGIKITGFTYGNFFAGIEEDLVIDNVLSSPT